jgi:3-hydroxyacyl-[acyl-carrier-protein] dehydratase
MSEIKNLLPHREPFLFVDELEEITEERIVGYRTFTDKEHFFQGHFPEYPVVPGVILVETMAQCGGAGVRELGVLGEKLFFLATVEKAKFRRQVRPNEKVRLEIENVRISKRMIKQSGKAMVGDEVAAEAEWMCLVGDAPA